MKVGIWSVCGASCLAAAAMAEDDAGRAYSSESDFFAEHPIVLSVARMAQPLAEAPAAVTVIDRDMIEASGFRHVADLLRLVPGFQVAWARGNLPTLTYHGLSSLFSRRLQVQVDGRSVYNPAYGQVQWRGLPLVVEDIERIEVVRGPNAAHDGANAFLGSINIITRHAAADRGLALGGNVGDQSVRDGLLQYAGRHGALDWRVTVASRQDDWIDTERDATADQLFNLRGDHRPNSRDELTLALGILAGDWQGSSVGYVFSPHQGTDFRNAYAQVIWRRTLDSDSEWSLALDYTHTRADEAFPVPDGLTAPDNLDYWFDRSAVVWSRTSRPSPSLRFAWAAEARQDRAWSRTLTGSERVLEGEMYRLSGGAEWAFAENWLLHPGIMLENHYYAGTRLSPRLALTWKFAPGHSLRLGVSRGYRSPTFLEQNSDFKLEAGDVVHDQILLSPYRLHPERITAWELGYVAQLPERRLQADVRLFCNRVRALIDFADPYPVPGEVMGDGADSTYANLFRADQRGLEFQLRWRATDATWLVFSQSWSNTDSDSAAYAASDPHSTTSLLLDHAFSPRWTGSLGYYRTGDLTWIGTEAPAPAYTRLDLRLARNWQENGRRWQLALVGQNLLGAHGEFSVARQVDQRGYVSLRVEFR